MIFTLSGPRGVGKTTVSDLLRDVSGIEQIVPYTTRDMREGERNGREYHFVSQDDFDRISKLGRGMFDVLACNGTFYGTPYSTFEEAATTKPNRVEDLSLVNVAIDTALDLRRTFGAEAVKTMFVLPQSWSHIELQMRDAGIPEDAIAARIAAEPTDLSRLPEADTIIVNGRYRIAGAFRAATDFIMAESNVLLNNVFPEDIMVPIGPLIDMHQESFSSIA